MTAQALFAGISRLNKANREIINKMFVYKFCLPIDDCFVSVGTWVNVNTRR